MGLTADRVLDGAMALADQIGIESLTIRRLAEALDVKPMTIYHHIPNKEAILDGMVDRVFAEMEIPPPHLKWRDSVVVAARSMLDVLTKHPWATPLLDSRVGPGRATLHYRNSMIGSLRSGGLSIEMTGHAIALLDSYVYGFALQVEALPATTGPDIVELTDEVVMPLDTAEYPHLMEFATEVVMQDGYDFRNEFDFGLELIINGIATASSSP